MSKKAERRNARQQKKFLKKLGGVFDLRRARRDTDLLAALRTVMKSERK